MSDLRMYEIKYLDITLLTGSPPHAAMHLMPANEQSHATVGERSS